MNVRIEEQNLRFKISEEELGLLLNGQCLSERVGITSKGFVITINPQGRGDGMEPKLVLDQTEACLQLLVPSEIVQELFEMGRSRSGISCDVDGVSISLQVNVRGDSRKRNNK